MQLHERQQFDFLLATAVERYVDTLIQRNEGAANALTRLQQNPNGEGIWLDRYVTAIFQDFLLDNAAGACFVLQALARQSARAPAAGSVETMLLALAKTAFAELLRQKTAEFLEQESMYGG